MTRHAPTRLTLRLITSAIACSAVLFATPTAFADTHKAIDAAGDVVQIDNSLNPTAAPDHQDADLRKVVVTHSNRRVIIKAKLRELGGLSGDEYIQLYAAVNTNKLDRAAVTFKTGPAKPIFQLRKGKKTVKCAGVRKTISPAKNLISMSIPRSCFGNPKWIKVGMASLSGDASEIRYYDEAYKTGSAVDETLRFTPKLRKG